MILNLSIFHLPCKNDYLCVGALIKPCSERKWKKINILKIRNKKRDYLCMLLSFIRHELKVTSNLLDIAT